MRAWVCPCGRENRGFFLLGHMSARMCARFFKHFFYPFLRGDPTHRLSPTDSVFIATEREGGEERKEEIMRCRRRRSQRQRDDSEGGRRGEIYQQKTKMPIFIHASTVQTDVSTVLTTMQQFNILMLNVTCASKMTFHCHVCSHFTRAGAADLLL